MIVAAPVAAALAGLALLTSMVVTAAARRIALRRNMLDLPGRRRSHVQPTPRGGGIGVLAGALLPLLASQWWLDTSSGLMMAYVVAAIAVAAVGWLDDVRGLAPLPRLVVHALAAALFVIVLQRASGYPIGLAGSVLAWFAIVSLINIWNFMDGINGIAGSQAALVALALAGLAGDAGWRLGALLLAAACIGFLPFNLPRARVFLGDVGSGAIGFMLAALMVQAVASAALHWPMALVLVSAFAVDSALTLGKRIVQRKAWWLPHREHSYQWLVRAGFPHWQVTLGYAVWTLLALAFVRLAPLGDGVSAAAIWLLATILIWFWLRAQVRRRLQRMMR